MDIGKFKASRKRLILWIAVPPLLLTLIGLSTYALRLQAEWELNRAETFSTVLPKLAQTHQQVSEFMEALQESKAFSIQSEDDLISYIQSVEQKSDFTIDALQVERQAMGKNMSMLIASVKGDGSFDAIEQFMGDVVSGQHLLFGSELKVSSVKENVVRGGEVRNADIIFRLILLDSLKMSVGGGK